VAPETVVIFGESLGGGVATDLAVRRTNRALVLVKTFTSVLDMARKQWLTSASAPLVRNQFDNLSKIGRCPTPVIIAHGDRDRVSPLAQARQLEAAAREPKRFLLLPGADHNDPLPAPFFAALADFLKDESRAAKRP
jgi:pimeloyl-ACP methyl ester carboxylesterase